MCKLFVARQLVKLSKDCKAWTDPGKQSDKPFSLDWSDDEDTEDLQPMQIDFNSSSKCEEFLK